jgi:hypothetical protein
VGGREGKGGVELWLVGFKDGVKDSVRKYCLAVIEMVIGSSFCMSILCRGEGLFLVM